MSKEENSIKVKRGELEKKITELLLKIGMPTHLKGFHCVRRAIVIAINYKDKKIPMSKFLYPEVAKEIDSTSGSVERCIRHAIEVLWDRGDVDYLNELFGCTISRRKGKPTNSEFISFIADKLRLEFKE